jgi:hypothetical protein
VIRRLILAFVLSATLAPAFAQGPPAVPALPDAERRTTYTISASNCACAVNFALYGDSTDYQNWIKVWLNGLRVDYNDPAFGWTITSPSGSIGNISRPITNAVLTFNTPQTGTVQIVGARRPRRVSQFSENRGVAARDLNQALTDIVAQNRETWDRTNDVTGRAILGLPGESIKQLPPASTRAGQLLGFDNTGQPIIYAPTSVSPAAGLCASHSWVSSISGIGSIGCTQPASTDLSDSSTLLRYGSNIQTVDYTVLSTDCNKTVQIGTGTTGLKTVTLPASPSGFPGGCSITINNGDTGRGKKLSGVPAGAPSILWPGQTITFGVINGAWVNLHLPGRYKLGAAELFNMYVDNVSGNDGNDCLAPGAGACATLQHMRDLAQQYLDLGGSASAAVIFNVAAQTFSGVQVAAYGPMFGQKFPTGEQWNFAAGAVLTGPTDTFAFEANYGAQLFINSVGGNLTFEAPGAAGGVCISAGVGSYISVPAMTFLGCTNTGIQTTWGGTLIVQGNLSIQGNSAQFIYASGGVVQLNPGLTHTFVSANYSKAFVNSYGQGVVGADGQTFVGATPVGPKWNAEWNAIIVVGSNCNTYFPGSINGTSATGGQCG